MEEKKKFNSKLILLYVFILLILVCIIFYFGRKKQSNNVTDNTANQSVIVMDKFVFKVDNKYKYSLDLDKNILTLFGKDAEWVAYVELYKNIKRNIYTDYEGIYNDLIKNGFDVKNPKLTTVGDTILLVMEYYKDDYVGFIAYMVPEDNYGFEITLYNDDKSLDTSSLNEVVNILNSYNS